MAAEGMLIACPTHCQPYGCALATGEAPGPPSYAASNDSSEPVAKACVGTLQSPTQHWHGAEDKITQQQSYDTWRSAANCSAYYSRAAGCKMSCSHAAFFHPLVPAQLPTSGERALTATSADKRGLRSSTCSAATSLRFMGSSFTWQVQHGSMHGSQTPKLLVCH